MSWQTDWFLTLRQSLPRVPTLFASMEPTFHLPGVAAIDVDFLNTHGYVGVIWDVDGTLMPRHSTAVAPHVQTAFQDLLASPQLRHVILSNSGERRYLQLGTIFPLVPVLRAYRTPKGVVFRSLRGGESVWSDKGFDQYVELGMPPIKKPSEELTEFAIRELDCRREQVVMVGDQYFTDIAGANLAGVHSIKVPTLARESFPFAVRQFQRIEGLAYRLRGSRESGAVRGGPARRVGLSRQDWARFDSAANQAGRGDVGG